MLAGVNLLGRKKDNPPPDEGNPVEAPADSAADSFFGENDSLGLDGPPPPASASPASLGLQSMGAAHTVPASARFSAGDLGDDDVPGLPRRSAPRLGWWLIPVVMAVALLVGVAAAMLLP